MKEAERKKRNNLSGTHLRMSLEEEEDQYLVIFIRKGTAGMLPFLCSAHRASHPGKTKSLYAERGSGTLSEHAANVFLFKTVQSVLFTAFTELCTSLTAMHFRTFASAPKGTLYPLAVNSHFPPTLRPQLLATRNLFSLHIDLTVLDISYKWNHALCGLLCLAPST